MSAEIHTFLRCKEILYVIVRESLGENRYSSCVSVVFHMCKLYVL